MDISEFKKNAYAVVDWMVSYLENIEDQKVLPDILPKTIYNQLPGLPPEDGEDFESIFEDFKRIIVPGMTHWQHPSFFGYFPANSSAPSVLAEMLTAALGAQCMSWQTSPAATELEDLMMEWLQGIMDLPPFFSGVIQDTGSTSTLCAALTAREMVSNFTINQKGFQGKKLICYCSTEAHSSVEKAIKIAGYGVDSLRKVAVDKSFAMKPEELEKAIVQDLAMGHIPTFVVAAIGTTGTTAVDPLKEIAAISNKYNLWLHVDAAYAGTAMMLPELRNYFEGIELADSLVFNPHKWMFTNFDCSAYFVKDKDALLKTFEILPEYLKTSRDREVNNYRDWGIQLGRRFRALKLWFVIRSFGVEGLRRKLRSQISLARVLEDRIKNARHFELMAPVPFNLVCFRFKPEYLDDEDYLNVLNQMLLEDLNKTGRMFITHTKVNGKLTLRMVIGQTNVSERHVNEAWELIQQTAKSLSLNFN